MEAIGPVLVGALLTAIVGNFLVQRWQLRNWREQQRQLGDQVALDDFKKLVEEISIKSADRHSAMRSLVSSLAPDSRVDFESALTDYRQQLVIWNSSLNSFYVRIRHNVDYRWAIRLEHEIHDPFRNAGVEIEKVIRSRKSGSPPNWQSLKGPKDLLDGLQARSYNFQRDLAAILISRKCEIFEGRKLYYAKGKLDEYSFLDLVKAIFVLAVDKHYIVRTP